LQNLSGQQLLALSNSQFSSMTDAQLQALSTLSLNKSLSTEAKTAATALSDTRNANIISFQSKRTDKSANCAFFSSFAGTGGALMTSFSIGRKGTYFSWIHGSVKEYNLAFNFIIAHFF
jgi:hypothetical protein